jgi:hypothetical protein
MEDFNEWSSSAKYGASFFIFGVQKQGLFDGMFSLKSNSEFFID